MSSSSPIVLPRTTTSSVFEYGNFSTVLQNVDMAGKAPVSAAEPPKPLLIAAPKEAGEFPVLILLHGYLLYNTFYSQLIQHIASHGFIAIAPQLYTVAGPNTIDEIKSTAAITNWLSQGLQGLLPSQVKPNLSKLVLAGHSRGGKAAFALLLKRVDAKLDLNFSALIGVDPVDGMGLGKQTHPPVLTYTPHSFDLNMPVMVIGSGLGEVKRNPLYPPCAPKGVNHEDFFRECKKPACYFVAKDFGHLDVLDDKTKGIRGRSSYCLCKNGNAREPMRRFVGGIMVAFMKAYIVGDNKDLIAIREGREVTPVELQNIQYFE